MTTASFANSRNTALRLRHRADDRTGGGKDFLHSRDAAGALLSRQPSPNRYL